MKLSVIILNYNVRYFLELCLLSVFRAIKTIDAEVIVVDNASKDDSISIIQSRFPKVKLIRNSTNVGFSIANNQGVNIAKGEYIFFLNPDTVVGESIFVKLLDFARSKSQLGIVGCKMIDGGGHYLPESKRHIPRPKVALQKFLGINKYYYANEISKSDIAQVPILTGANMFMKKEVFGRINGFDDAYFMYGEDIDISYKSFKKGFKNYYYGAETLIHFKGESTIKNAQYLKNFYGAMGIFYEKHFRKNKTYDFLVYMGLKLFPLLNNSSKNNSEIGSRIVFLSEDAMPKYENLAIRETTSLNSTVSSFELDTLIINTACYSFEQIIDFISTFVKGHYVKFRLYVPDSHYIIGSDSKTSKGQVIQLKEYALEQ